VPDCLRSVVMVVRRHTPHPEFVHYVAVNGYTADVLREHTRAGDECARCGQLWPCNMRQVAEQALAYLAGGRDR
jgi:hypothetical protein